MLTKINNPLSRMLNSSSHIVLYDFVRIACAVLIFLRHSITMYGLEYNKSITLLAKDSTLLVMILFFILSGISTFLSTRKTPPINRENTITFYKKRLLAIAPGYILLHILYMFIISGQQENGLRLLPVTLSFTQSGYHTLFGIFNFGGTWFIGCLAFCYFAYPLVHSLIHPLRLRAKFVLFFLVIGMHYYGEWVVQSYKLNDNYDHPLYRFTQFLIGVLLMEVLTGISEYAKGKYQPIPFILSTLLLLGLVIAVLVDHDLFYAFLKAKALFIPVVLIIFTAFYYIRIPVLSKSRILRYISKLTYEIYLFQMLSWQISGWILGEDPTNTAKIWTSILVTIVLSVAARFISDMIRKLILRCGAKKQIPKKEKFEAPIDNAEIPTENTETQENAGTQ